MKVFVYGTLKRGYGNCVRTGLAGKTFVEEKTLKGFKLFNAGFPVATPSENDSIKGEIWDIGNDGLVLANLDRLESNGSMYHRTHIPEENVSLYVGDRGFWSEFRDLSECPKDEKGVYVWAR